MSEFSLIAKYFTRPAANADLGVGDDAALLRVQEGHQLAISVDMLVAGTHFYKDADPYTVGWKSMAVNISDMAAMGAAPKWATLAIALPKIDEDWLAEFARGLFACAERFNVSLIGGDTTHGPLNISVQIMGEVPTSQALVRASAQADDDIWVSGHLGSAALGLAHLQQKVSLPETALTHCLQRLHTPTPRVDLGLALRGIASSCIDVSDGLLADLGHILHNSKVGASIHLEQIACHDYLKNRLEQPLIQQCITAGGDDYELIFTAPRSKRDVINTLSGQLNLPLSLIGAVTAEQTLQVQYQARNLNIARKGYDHFE